MRIIIQILIVLCVGCVVSSCGVKQVMTKRESNLIRQFPANTPFRVLAINEPLDYTVLRAKSSDVDPKSKETKLLIERMKATLEVEEGVGIAAPQVGITRNLFLFVRVDKPDAPVEVAVNPQITNHSEETVCFERDGCLSVPGVYGNTVRYSWIDVAYTNEHGERIEERLEGHSRADNFVAVIFQHEYDHLQGVLYFDRLCEEPESTLSED